MIGICLDCLGQIAYIKPFVSGHELDIDVYIDKNGDLKRSLGINILPYTILYDQHHKVICKYAGFCISSDEMLADKLNQCLNKMANSK